MSTTISVIVGTDKAEDTARAVETLARAAIGIALEGIPVHLWIEPTCADDEDTDLGADVTDTNEDTA